MNNLTPAKFNIAPEKLPSQKERILFQPSLFTGKLLNFGGVDFAVKMVGKNVQKICIPPPKWCVSPFTLPETNNSPVPGSHRLPTIHFSGIKMLLGRLHPGRLTCNPKMKVWFR